MTTEHTENPDNVTALVPSGRILDRDQRELKVEMSAEDIRAASRRMGLLMRQRRQKEAELDVIKQTFKGELTKFDDEINALGRVLDTETEERLVECITRVNWADGTAETERIDTHEIIARRPLTQKERQQEMFHQSGVGPGQRRGENGNGDGKDGQKRGRRDKDSPKQ